MTCICVTSSTIDEQATGKAIRDDAIQESNKGTARHLAPDILQDAIAKELRTVPRWMSSCLLQRRFGRPTPKRYRGRHLGGRSRKSRLTIEKQPQVTFEKCIG